MVLGGTPKRQLVLLDIADTNYLGAGNLHAVGDNGDLYGYLRIAGVAESAVNGYHSIAGNRIAPMYEDISRRWASGVCAALHIPYILGACRCYYGIVSRSPLADCAVTREIKMSWFHHFDENVFSRFASAFVLHFMLDDELPGLRYGDNTIGS